MTSDRISGSSILFVTGRLAEASLRETLTRITERVPFRFQVAVPGVQVAALLHVSLLLRRLEVPDEIDRVIVPGWCQGDLNILTQHFGCPFERGPKDLRDLPEFFGLGRRRDVALDRYSIEIIGEINHATRLPLHEVVEQAAQLCASGADVIDVGCIPGESSREVADIVRALRNEGCRVSIDSFDRAEVEAAVASGAELILSCNHSNVDWVTQLQTEVVAIPDTPADMNSLDQLILRLQSDGIPFRADPIIEPIGMGFTASLARYLAVRQKHPRISMMMGIGNITELTEVDSAGVNMILAAICEELGIQSVLTTQVINWCRSAVAEFDAARRLTWHACTQGIVPKHISSALVMLRDPRWTGRSAESLEAMSQAITDSHFRIFAEAGELHLMNSAGYWKGSSSFELFGRALAAQREPVDASHAFYLGYEMARAELSLHLGKRYEQDEPIRWGLLGDWQGSSTVHPPDAAQGSSSDPL